MVVMVVVAATVVVTIPIHVHARQVALRNKLLVQVYTIPYMLICVGVFDSFVAQFFKLNFIFKMCDQWKRAPGSYAVCFKGRIHL